MIGPYSCRWRPFFRVGLFRPFLRIRGGALSAKPSVRLRHDSRGTTHLAFWGSSTSRSLRLRNLHLFARMNRGNLPTERSTWRANIAVNAANVGLRDQCSIASGTPCIIALGTMVHVSILLWYYWAHTLIDYVRRIPHSVCTLEVELNGPLYYWILGALGTAGARPHQLTLRGSIFLLGHEKSKRKLIPAGN